MMKLLFFLFLNICTATLIAQEVRKESYENGNIKAEGAYNSSKIKTGHWKYYYPNGKLEAEGAYAGQKANARPVLVRKGRNSAVNDEGVVRKGKWTFYYTNGQPKASITYNDGCPEGSLTKWYKTGEKMEQSSYKGCGAATAKKIWDKEGWLKQETINEGNERSVQIEWYKNGQKKAAIPYKRGKQYGRVKRWYESGQREEEVMMKNTRVHGSYRSWYPNGKKQREFFSINNVMSGEYREWNDKGQLVWEIRELTDEKKILVISYWPDGTVKMKGKSNMPTSLSIHEWSQTRDGYWTYWYQQKVTRSEKYNNGQLLTVEMP
ncbi:MAG: toxin-antitoxin system YwqK family antitoxin [Aureispira sp.]